MTRERKEVRIGSGERKKDKGNVMIKGRRKMGLAERLVKRER